MGFLIGLIKRIIKLILYSGIAIAIVLLIPNLPPYTKFTSFEIEPSQPRIGPLTHNDILNNAEHLFEGKLLGPEYFQIYNDELYTGLATGEIVKISPGGHVTFVTKIGQPCNGVIQEHICGRPLGFDIDKKNKEMYVADAYHGIWRVNLVTDKKQLLVSPQVPISGRKPRLFNAVVLDTNGNLYWTDSSSDYQLKDGVMATLADPVGRLFYYNAAKNESKVLLDDLWFPNGVAISPDNQFVVVAESSRLRLLKYYINGPKKGKSEVFVSGLPGYPDTVRALPDGSGVLISLYEAFDEDSPILAKTMASAPLARKFLLRLLHLIQIPFEFLNTQFKHHIFEDILYRVGGFESISGLGSGMSGLVQVDWDGKIVASYYNTDGSLLHISDAIVFKDKLYTGAPNQHTFVGSVPAPPLLKKAFTSVVKELPKAHVKASEQAKPKVEEKKEVPTQQQLKDNAKKTIENKENVKKNKVSDDSETKPKVASKKADVNSKTVPKEADVKSKTVAKEAEVKPKVVPKEEAKKPKVVSNNAKKEPVVISKDDKIKKIEPEKNTKTSNKQSEDKPKVDSKAQETKPKDTIKEPSSNKIKHDTKEGTKDKPSQAADVKPKTEKKETAQTKPVSKQAETKPKTKSDDVQKKPENLNVKKQNAEEKVKKANTEAKPKIAETKPKPAKPIPVEEEIPSDTAKPSKETLKVIKKSGPQEIPHPNV